MDADWNMSVMISEQARIGPELAAKLFAIFGNSGTFWTKLQSNYELWHDENKSSVLESYGLNSRKAGNQGIPEMKYCILVIGCPLAYIY
jgi:plasmid maintenance system antidote protein VapI